MRHLIFLILTFLFISACSECVVMEGQFASSGGSEQQTYLELLPDKTFVLKHETWQPGHFENRNTTEITGAWSCKGNQIKLNIDGRIYSAGIITIGKNPLGMSEDTRALHFEENKETSHSYLGNEIFYLE